MTERTILEIINQLFEIRKKSLQSGFDKLDRNLERMATILEAEGYKWIDPTGERYDESRTDCTATILSEKEPMIISETMKPIIFGPDNIILQQARVIIQ